MKKSTKRSDVGYAKEVKYSSAPIPRNDMTEFMDQIHYNMTPDPNYVDDSNPENWLHKISMGMQVGI